MFRMLTLAALATSTAAFAGDDNPAATPTPASETAIETAATKDATTTEATKFTKLDIDNDKKLSMVEVAAVADLNESFMTVDADADGTLSRTEYDAWAKLKIQDEKTETEKSKTE